MGIRGHNRGLTLIELLIVVAILVALAAGVVVMLSRTTQNAQAVATAASLRTVRETIVGTEGRPGYLADMRCLPATMKDLFVKPAGAAAFDRFTARGWRGPYLAESTGKYVINSGRGFLDAYGDDDDPALLDGWGNPIVIQRPSDASGADSATRDQFTRLVSAGPDGKIETSPDVLYPDPNTGRGDDVVLFLTRTDVAP